MYVYVVQCHNIWVWKKWSNCPCNGCTEPLWCLTCDPAEGSLVVIESLVLLEHSCVCASSVR